MAEKELAKLQERCSFLGSEVEGYVRLLKDELYLRDEILTSLRDNFLTDFEKTVADLSEQLRQN